MIKVIKSGLYSTIQDKGRIGYGAFGVPLSGVMDSSSADLANSILGNDLSCAVLEMTFVGAKLLFKTSAQICVSGALMEPRLNNKSIPFNTAIPVNVGDTLSFGRLTNGLRTYLAVKGGFKTKEVLGSRSQYKGITSTFQLKDNDEFVIQESQNTDKVSMKGVKIKPQDFSSEYIECYKGPEFGLLPYNIQEVLLENSFKVSNLYNRMAYQLNPNLENDLPSILTSPVLPGTVQLTPSGKLIVLMLDCQTTGGYPRVLQLSEKGINLLSQKKEGDRLQFQLID